MYAFPAKIVRSILVRIAPSRFGFEIKPKGLGYFDAKTVIHGAQAAGVSVIRYLEDNNIGGVGKRRDEIVQKLQSLGVMTACRRILEIGAGTGMYLEKFMEICSPKKYEVYETNVGWSKYLENTYSGGAAQLVIHDADGSTLKETEDDSIDLVVAHGVFVYLPVIVTIRYLEEAARTCRKNGLIIFDCFSDKVFTLEEINVFRKRNNYYDFPVIFPENLLRELCIQLNVEMQQSFNVEYHSTKSTYFILKKN